MWGRRKDKEEPRPEVAQLRLVAQAREQLALGQLDPAFELAEAALDTRPCAEAYEGLIGFVDRNVQERDVPRLRGMLAELEKRNDSRHAPWRLYVRFLILERLSQTEQAFAASAALTHLPNRYAWMRYDRAGLLLIRLWAYEEADREYKATLESAPRFWKAAASLAESALCQGREQESFALFDKCLAGVRRHGLSSDLEMATVWRAELKLWVGRYQEAAGELDGPAEAGHQLALGWRGAARLLLGDPSSAIVDLDRAIALNPSDGEAIAWRGEAQAKLERWPEALADFDRAGPLMRAPLWTLVGRALVKARTGDTTGFWADFDRLPRSVVGFFQPAAATREVEVAVGVLTAIRTAARGLRRPEQWLYPIWMKSRP